MSARPAYDERSKASCTPTKPADCEQSEQNATVIAAIFQRTSLSTITDSLKQQFSNSPDIVTVSVTPTTCLASPQIWALSGRQAEACPVMGVTSGDNRPSPWGCHYRLGRVCEETGFKGATHASMVTSIIVVEISPTKRFEMIRSKAMHFLIFQFSKNQIDPLHRILFIFINASGRCVA
jgi:hypothetical protein